MLKSLRQRVAKIEETIGPEPKKSRLRVTEMPMELLIKLSDSWTDGDECADLSHWSQAELDELELYVDE